jgi:hypothetical protein
LLITAAGLGLLARIRPEGSLVGDVLIPSLIIALGLGLSTVPLMPSRSGHAVRRADAAAYPPLIACRPLW